MITIRNKNLFCTNCGTEEIINYPVGVKEFVDLEFKFRKKHKKCPQTWSEPKVDQSLPERKKAEWWFTNGEIGASSRTIYEYFTGRGGFAVDHPHDISDFGRCYKLLETVPEWRSRIKELSVLSKTWKNLAENWDKLTEMYEENIRMDWKNSEEIGMYKFMQELIKGNLNRKDL